MSRNIKQAVDAKSQQHRGYKNYKTWELAVTIQNNEGLYNMCKDLYSEGYVTYSAMRCKLMEFGHLWKADHLTTINWNDDTISAKEISKVLKDLFSQP